MIFIQKNLQKSTDKKRLQKNVNTLFLKKTYITCYSSLLKFKSHQNCFRRLNVRNKSRSLKIIKKIMKFVPKHLYFRLLMYSMHAITCGNVGNKPEWILRRNGVHDIQNRLWTDEKSYIVNAPECQMNPHNMPIVIN